MIPSLCPPGLDKETCLIPSPPQHQAEFCQSYSLLTENLILTQLTLHLGFHRYTHARSYTHVYTHTRTQVFKRKMQHMEH
jgi:hypothetical protein